MHQLSLICLTIGLFACSPKVSKTPPIANTTPVVAKKLTDSLLTGAQQLDNYLPQLRGKRIALVVNHSSLIGKTHLVDTLLKSDINIVKVFAPEHGFRGTAADGAIIQDEKDPTTGLPIISLYGKNKKPTSEELTDVDIVVFDIQDVGVRFYTYISTLHYVMEACCEQQIPILVLDRPNPNVHFIDGPILDPAFRSFIGMHPVPVVYGMTIGEYARMIKGESWIQCQDSALLTVVPLKHFKRFGMHTIHVHPSPNLRSMRAMYLYPSLCFFEGTIVSVGRGTAHPFECIGHPEFKEGSFAFKPENIPGVMNPPHVNVTCYGQSFSNLEVPKLFARKEIDLRYLIHYYQVLHVQQKLPFFLDNGHFDKLAGTDKLRKQIIANETEKQIKASWQKDLHQFKKRRIKYVLY